MFGKIWKLSIPHGDTSPGFAPRGEVEIGALPRAEQPAPGDALDRVHAVGGHQVARDALPSVRAHHAVRTVDLVVRAVERCRRVGARGRYLLLRVQDRRVVELLERVEVDLPVAEDLRPVREPLGHLVERVALERRDHRAEELAQ
jgi:hypothetical protein